MKESSPFAVHFLDEYGRISDRANKSLREYLGDPGTSQTHSLRSSVRRLDAAIKVLPKSTKRVKEVRRCHERCRALLRGTSRIRDIDVLHARLSRPPGDETVTLVLNNLMEERGEYVGDSTEAAWKLFEHHPPKLARRDLPRLARRMEGVLRRLEEEIGEGLEVCLKDEAKIDALHGVRKDCKRLRYTLELTPPGARSAAVLPVLRRWLDILGEIRDCDVTIDYLKRAKQSAAVGTILAQERAQRHAKYLSFVRLCRGTRQNLAAFPLRVVALPAPLR